MGSLLLLLSLGPSQRRARHTTRNWNYLYSSMKPMKVFSKFQLKVGPPDGIYRDYIPGKSFNMKVQGDPGAKVGLVAVDNAVYLLKKDRLTQSKVCVEVKKRSCVIYQQFRQKRCPNIQRGRTSRKKSFLGESERFTVYD